jgi:uncharacterized protein YaiI (UPF0178 family)
MRIWIDADACPGDIKTFIFRTARRRNLTVYVVANRHLYVPPSPSITFIRVAAGPDEADRYIVQHVTPNDLVVTADIPLAAAVVDQQAVAIDPRGAIYTAENVKERLAMRNLMQQLRSDGLLQGGPAQLSATDRQKFAAALDRTLTRLLKAT